MSQGALHWLDLSDNIMLDSGLAELVGAIEGSEQRVLRELKFNSNRFSAQGQDVLRFVLGENKKIAAPSEDKEEWLQDLEAASMAELDGDDVRASFFACTRLPLTVYFPSSSSCLLVLVCLLAPAQEGLNGTLLVTVVSGAGLLPADFSGKADPYVVYVLPAQHSSGIPKISCLLKWFFVVIIHRLKLGKRYTFRTAHKNRTLSPTWDETFEFELLGSFGLPGHPRSPISLILSLPLKHCVDRCKTQCPGADSGRSRPLRCRQCHGTSHP